MTTASSKPLPFDLDEFVASAMAEYDTAPKATPKKATPPKKEDVVAVEPPKPIALKADESLFSTLFGSVPKNMTDFAVRKFTDVPSNFTHLIPKRDTKYVVQTEEAARLVAALMDGDKVLLSGPTGSGKSSLVK
jgi:hypothetical protein